MLSNARGSVSLVYRPYHLCGIEATRSILQAGLYNLPAGTDEYLPRFDVIARARRQIKPGEIVRQDDLE